MLSIKDEQLHERAQKPLLLSQDAFNSATVKTQNDVSNILRKHLFHKAKLVAGNNIRRSSLVPLTREIVIGQSWL